MLTARRSDRTLRAYGVGEPHARGEPRIPEQTAATRTRSTRPVNATWRHAHDDGRGPTRGRRPAVALFKINKTSVEMSRPLIGRHNLMGGLAFIAERDGEDSGQEEFLFLSFVTVVTR